MQYLVDGYNLLFRLSKTRLELKQKRIQQICALNDAVSVCSLNVTLVFDGSDDSIPYPARQHFDALSIYYTTKGLSADDFILHTIKTAQHPDHFTVVTNDRDLATNCKVYAEKIMPLEKFLTILLKKKTKQDKKAQPVERAFKDTDREIARLLAIFERRTSEINEREL